jgi:hypothetical protein
MQPPLFSGGYNREDRLLYAQLLRDVCFLFHELSAYRYIMGDLDYGTDYTLDYWELLNRTDTGQPDDRLIRSGILVLTLAMLEAAFDDSGNHIWSHIPCITKAIENFVPEDFAMLRLGEAVEHGLDLLKTKAPRDERYEIDIAWAHKSFVRAYFVDRST